MLNKNLEINQTLYWKFNPTDKMMYSAPYPWNGPYREFSGKGDALWRTSLAYITYGDPELKQGIINCFRKFTMINYPKKYWYQASRCSNRYREDDVSRDQVILALAALYIRHDFVELKDIADHLPFKLSRRFNMTLTMWVWMKYLTTNKRIYSTAHHIFNSLEMLIAIPLSKFLRKKAKVDKYMPPGTYISDEIKKTFWYKIYNFLQLHGYVLHLKAWQYYTSNKKSLFAKINSKLMLRDVEEDNYLLCLLLSENNVDIETYRSVSNWRANIRFNGDHDGTVWYLNPNEVRFNQMDKDVLIFLKNN